jgi:hypothetical protein
MMRTAGNSEPAPMGRKLRRLGADVVASGDELREFLQQFRGKSPQEVLGLVASSGLVRATCMAAAGCVVLVAVFTVLPYAWGRAFGRAGSSAADVAAMDRSSAVPPGGASSSEGGRQPGVGDGGSTQAGSGPAGAAASSATGAAGEVLDAAGQPPPPGSEAILDKLNIDSEPVDPDVNPLEEANDDLLDDLK